MEQKKENGYDMMIETRAEGQFYIASICNREGFIHFSGIMIILKPEREGVRLWNIHRK